MSSSNAFDVLRKDLEVMYTNKVQTDVKLKVGTEVFDVHKFIISARSPVFRAMFDQDMVESQTKVVYITDVDVKTLDMFLKFLYTGSCGEVNWECSLNLMLVGEKYQVCSLKKDCSDYLIQTLSEDNVCNVLIVADMVSDRSLKGCAMDYVKSHADKVLPSDSWKELVKNNVSLASEILSMLSADFGAIATEKKGMERESKSSTSELSAQQLPTKSMNDSSTISATNFETGESSKALQSELLDYKHFASSLLLIVSQDGEDKCMLPKLSQLSILARHVDCIGKKLIGDLGAITVMLQIIEKRLERQMCDEVMKLAWSIMSSLTDETPINASRFLKGKGMDLFLQCLEVSPKRELLKKMLILLVNVAEEKELRSFLMKGEYLSIFRNLLDVRGNDISYLAAGILSHIASDGPQSWIAHQITNVSRKTVLLRMVHAIQSWDLNTKPTITFKSLKPILRLLSAYHTPEAQYWAVWTLANLTNSLPEKYCSLLQKEDGIPLLENLTQQVREFSISELAENTIENWKRL